VNYSTRFDGCFFHTTRIASKPHFQLFPPGWTSKNPEKHRGKVEELDLKDPKCVKWKFGQAVRIPMASAEVCKPSLENSSHPSPTMREKFRILKKHMVSLRGSSFVIHDECCVASAWKKHVVVKKKKNRRRIRSVKTPCSIYQCTWIITTLFRGPFFQCLTHQGCVAKAVAAVFHGVGKPFELQEVQKSVNGWMVGG